MVIGHGRQTIVQDDVPHFTVAMESDDFPSTTYTVHINIAMNDNTPFPDQEIRDDPKLYPGGFPYYNLIGLGVGDDSRGYETPREAYGRMYQNWLRRQTRKENRRNMTAFQSDWEEEPPSAGGASAMGSSGGVAGAWESTSRGAKESGGAVSQPGTDPYGDASYAGYEAEPANWGVEGDLAVEAADDGTAYHEGYYGTYSNQATESETPYLTDSTYGMETQMGGLSIDAAKTVISQTRDAKSSGTAQTTKQYPTSSGSSKLETPKKVTVNGVSHHVHDRGGKHPYINMEVQGKKTSFNLSFSKSSYKFYVINDGERVYASLEA